MNPMLVLFGSFSIFLLLGMPIAFCIGLSVAVFFIFASDMPLTFLATNLFAAVDSFPLMAIPFFILSGGLMQAGGLSKRLVDFASSLVGHWKGGLAMVTVLTCALFGSISGSAPATVAAVGTIMIPFMLQAGYPKGFTVALVAAGGCLGVILPPSIPMVMFGVATGASIGNLFLAGFLPGILCLILLMIAAQIVARKKGYGGGERPFEKQRVITTFKSAIPALLVPVIILGGIYGGIFTPTEAAVVAVFYGLLAGLFIYRELTFSKVLQSLGDSALTTGTILVIVGTGFTFGRVLAISGVPDAFVAGMTGITENVFVMLLLVNLFLLFFGLFTDTIVAILIFAPLLWPVMSAFGVHIVHFGIMMVVNLAIGFITPPVGVNLFTGIRISGASFSSVVKAVLPMVAALIVGLMLLTYIPNISLLIPRLFGRIPW